MFFETFSPVSFYVYVFMQPNLNLIAIQHALEIIVRLYRLLLDASNRAVVRQSLSDLLVEVRSARESLEQTRLELLRSSGASGFSLSRVADLLTVEQKQQQQQRDPALEYWKKPDRMVEVSTMFYDGRGMFMLPGDEPLSKVTCIGCGLLQSLDDTYTYELLCSETKIYLCKDCATRHCGPLDGDTQWLLGK